MHILKVLPVLAVALAGCVPPPQATVPAPSTGQVTPVSWKTGVPRAQRAEDILSCEYAARGLGPEATAEEFSAATDAIGLDNVAAFVTNCVTQKGYTKTVMPVCSSAQITAGQFVQGPAEFLPPLSEVTCIVVDQGFVV